MVLKAEHISKSYRNGSLKLTVLKDVSLTIQKGDLITIMGPSGAGKSTLLNILGTLDKPDEGSIEFKGQKINGLNAGVLAKIRNRNLGFVFQFHHLLPEFTALENILMPVRIGGFPLQEQKALELLDYVGLTDRKDHYPAQLSGGERSRVAVLRSLINNPDLVLADEPTGNLDLSNAQKLLDLFKQINRDFQQAFVITTHNPQVAEIGQQKFYLDNGTLSAAESI
jgi:lipoprotein-releasing system ATP-binding protein